MGIGYFAQAYRNLRKPQDRAPLLTDLRRESQGKEPRKAHACTPYQIPKRKASNPSQKICQEKTPKITKKRKWRSQNQA
jgi:hypothetical protein